jgi:hypothetical protein
MEFVEYDTKSASPEKEKAANSLRVNGFHWLREQDLNLKNEASRLEKSGKTLMN